MFTNVPMYLVEYVYKCAHVLSRMCLQMYLCTQQNMFTNVPMFSVECVYKCVCDLSRICLQRPLCESWKVCHECLNQPLQTLANIDLSELLQSMRPICKTILLENYNTS